MKGQHFVTIEEIKTGSLTELKAIPQQELHKCWHKSIVPNGDYVEGDNINFINK